MGKVFEIIIQPEIGLINWACLYLILEQIRGTFGTSNIISLLSGSGLAVTYCIMLGQIFLLSLGVSLALGIGTEDILRLRQEIAEIQQQLHRYVLNYSKPVLSGHSRKLPKLVFKTDYRLMQVKSIAECSKRAFCNTSDLYEATICL